MIVETTQHQISEHSDRHTAGQETTSYLHRTRIQGTVVHHHLREEIQFKGSHGSKISLRFFKDNHAKVPVGSEIKSSSVR